MLTNKIEINRAKVNPQQTQFELDQLAVEEPLQISLLMASKRTVFSLTMRTPGHDRELVHGVLLTEGIINSKSDIVEVAAEKFKTGTDGNQLCVQLAKHIKLDLSDKVRRHPSYSGCGLCGKTSLQALELKAARPMKTLSILLDNQLIEDLIGQLAFQPLFNDTGGVHAAGLIYEKKGVLEIKYSPFFEDVGRHNALDKLIGHELMVNDLQQAGILLLSGRIGFELVQKAIVAGFSIIVALGAPTSLAVQAARQFNVTLIGFAKNKSFNLYTADQHLLAASSK